MSVKLLKISILAVAACLLLRGGAASLISNPSATNGVLALCPGEHISITCSHNNDAGELTRWELHNGTHSSCTKFVLHNNHMVEEECPQGSLWFTNISLTSDPPLTSTAHLTATESLDGTVVECRAGGLSTSPPVGNVTIHVRGIPSILNWTANLTTNREGSVLEWGSLDNSDYQRCVTGYTISWNGGQYNTTDASTSVSKEVLHQHGFPYCETKTVTVTSLTLVGPVVSLETNITLSKPGFRIPVLLSFFNKSELVITTQKYFSHQFQMYGIANGTSCVPNTPFNGSSVTTHLSGAKAGDTYTVCVMVQDNDCTAVSSTSVLVPTTNLTVQQKKILGTSYTISLILPLTRYSPSELLIISSISPPHNGPTTTTFPSSTFQHTVIFNNLTSGVQYTYTIRVVLASDSVTDVVPRVTGSFSIPTDSPTQTRTCGTGCIVGITLSVVCVISVMILIVVFSVWLWKTKCKRNIDYHSASDIAALSVVCGFLIIQVCTAVTIDYNCRPKPSQLIQLYTTDPI